MMKNVKLDATMVDIPVEMLMNQSDNDTITSQQQQQPHYHALGINPHHHHHHHYTHNPHQPVKYLSPTSSYQRQSQQQHQQTLMSPMSPMSPNSSSQIWVPRNNDVVDGKETPVETLMSNVNPAFTIRRHIIHIQEENKQIENLKKTIESRLKIQMPPAASVDELGVALSDGVVLCHLVNHIFPRAVAIIHVPSLPMVSYHS